MNKWLPTLVTLAVTVVGALAPQIQAAVASHPTIALVLGGVYAVVKGLLPSPVSSK